MQKVDREFIASLVSLISNIRRAMDMHEDMSGSARNPAELITGNFDGIKRHEISPYRLHDILQEEYGTKGVTQQGVELFFTSISKIFESLQAVYKGQFSS
ncbi:hypothetical protein U1Q18_052050 [Sarracenia purpurea var. burkii]